MSSKTSKLNIEKLDPSELPSISEVSQILEDTLKAIFRENYQKYVIKQDKDRFILLPPRYLHFPPILITIQHHPENQSKALFITILRKIPIDSQEDIKELLRHVDTFLGVEVEIIGRGYKIHTDEEKKKSTEPKIFYLVLSHRMHTLSLKDRAWLLLILSSIIRVDDKLFLEIQETRYVEPRRETLMTEYT